MSFAVSLIVTLNGIQIMHLKLLENSRNDAKKNHALYFPKHSISRKALNEMPETNGVM